VAVAGPGEPAAEDGPRKRDPAPWPPFVEVTAQDRGPRGAAEQVLPQGAHLNDAKNLRKRQMGPDDPKRAAILAKLGNDGAAVAMPRQVQKRQLLDLDPAPGKQDNAKKAVALGAPALRQRAVELAHPRAGLDIAKSSVPGSGVARR
jgi:hypothetical protein